MANQYQRDLAERLLATLPSPTTPALKGAVRGIAYYDTGTARKAIKFLKQHVEDLRIGEEKAVQQYDGHKERTTEGLDHVSVRGQYTHTTMELTPQSGCRELPRRARVAGRRQARLVDLLLGHRRPGSRRVPGRLLPRSCRHEAYSAGDAG